MVTSRAVRQAISEQEIAARHQVAVMAAIGDQERLSALNYQQLIAQAEPYLNQINGRLANAQAQMLQEAYCNLAQQQAQWWVGYGNGMSVSDTHNRSLALLKDWLSPDQLASYEAHKNFIVTSNTGNRYRINYGMTSNVDQLNDAGETIASLCFQPTGCQSIGDAMLAQKMMLETDEAAVLRIANRTELRHASLYAEAVRLTADVLDRQMRRAMSPGPVQNGP